MLSRLVVLMAIFLNIFTYAMHQNTNKPWNYYQPAIVAFYESKDLATFANKKDFWDVRNKKHYNYYSTCAFGSYYGNHLHIKQIEVITTMKQYSGIFKLAQKQKKHFDEKAISFVFDGNTLTSIGQINLSGPLHFVVFDEKSTSNLKTKAQCAAFLKREKSIIIDPQCIALKDDLSQAACVTLNGQIFFFEPQDAVSLVVRKNKGIDTNFFFN